MKQEAYNLLASDDFTTALAKFPGMPLQKVINPLFSFLYHTEDNIRWHAVSAMGVVTKTLADQDMESARVIFRRLIWNLNDESGGIGWGSPEAMGDIMARSRKMALEYAHMLVSYILPHGNFLEHEVLQRGVLWGLYRLGGTFSFLTVDAVPYVREYLTSHDPYHRGLAACFAGTLGDTYAVPALEQLTHDHTMISLYGNYQMLFSEVAELAVSAISAIDQDT